MPPKGATQRFALLGRKVGALALTRAERREAEAALRELESRAREAAEVRVAELDAELRRRGGACDGLTRQPKTSTRPRRSCARPPERGPTA